MQQMWILLAGLLVSFSVSAKDCRSVHRTFNPESLYLSLKIEEWTYHPIPLRSVARVLPLPESIREQLILEHSDKYDIANLSPDHLARFYLNHLRAQYIQAANRWMTQEVQFLTGGRQTKFAAQLLEQVMAIRSLTAHEMSPETAQELFATKPWRSFPWKTTLDLIDAFESSGIQYSRSNFTGWIDREPHGLSASEVNAIIHAYDRSKWKKLPICCLSTPGCYDCPTNRRWLRKL